MNSPTLDADKFRTENEELRKEFLRFVEHFKCFEKTSSDPSDAVAFKRAREVLNNSAEFFDPNNIEDISYKIEKIIFSNFLSKDLIKKGFERSNFFSWKKTTEETFKIYKKII